jgi:predicted transposase/invertase (TIGR01784 family)
LDKIPPEFNNKLFRPVFEIAEICNFNEVELRDYEANMKYLDDYNATIEYAKKEGVLKGILQTAKNMLNEGLKPRTVARCTKLPLEQIIALK